MWGLLLPPIIGGYFFITRSRFTKYRFEYLDQQRLLFESVLYGLSGFIVSVLIGFVTPELLDQDPQAWNKRYHLPDFTLHSLGAGILLVTFGWLTSQTDKSSPGRRSPHLNAAIKSVGDELDNLLLSAYVHNTTLLITLDNGKIYVVLVHSTPKPRQTKYVEFIPMFSGYRNSTHELVITTNYLEVSRSHPEATFRIVIELADITSLQPWDEEIYNAKFRQQQTKVDQEK